MRVAFRDYGGKGERLAAALVAAGHELDPHNGDVAVIDLDHPAAGLDLAERHDRTVTYPHGGNPVVWWDAHPPHPHLRLHLVHGAGHAAVAALYNHPVPMVPVGFSYCDVAPARYPATVRKVLFAPTHPMDNRWIEPAAAAANAAALTALIRSGLDVTVRYWGRRSDWGLDDDGPNIAWDIACGLDTDMIDIADIVIADGTFAALAAARGCPLLYVAADAPADMSGCGAGDYPPRQHRWAPVARYPYDIGDGPLDELGAAVTQPDAAVDRWRDLFVGGPFDADLAVRLIEAVAA